MVLDFKLSGEIAVVAYGRHQEKEAAKNSTSRVHRNASMATRPLVRSASWVKKKNLQGGIATEQKRCIY